MELHETIQRRHSYRGPYAHDPVPRETLRLIAEAGLKAPSGMNAQAVSLVIVDDPGVVGELTAILDKPRLDPVPAYIVCAIDETPSIRDMNFGVEDCAAAVENMLLTITARGLASVWLDGCLRAEARAERIATLLNIPATLTVRVVLPVGVPEERHEPKDKKPFAERAWFNRYGGK